MNSPALLFSAVAALTLVGCTLKQPPPVVETKPPEPQLYAWRDDGGSGSVKVRINLSSQRAYFTRGGRPIGWAYVATGKDGHDTPAGTYRITEKIVDKNSNRYGWIENEYGDRIDNDASPGDYIPPGGRYVAAPMPYWMRLTSYGIGMHAGYIPQPGVPASHGCIRLPKPLAPKLFNAVTVGTQVKVEYGPSSEPWSMPPAPSSGSSSPAGEFASPPVRMRNGRRVVSPDDPWIVWPKDHPFAGSNR